MEYDFSGWASRANVRCSDGRMILPDAFKQNDGEQVPLVYNHRHDDLDDVLGHAVLENRADGVYAYCKFNNTEAAKTARILVEDGSVNALSIWANELKQNDKAHVLHGNIKEVSLVLAGANPGAHIDSIIKHGESFEEEAIIYNNGSLELRHSYDSEKNDNATVKETNKPNSEGEETVEDVFNTFNEKQKTVVYALVGQALEHAGQNSNEEETSMKHNVFDQAEKKGNNTFLSHADQAAILEEAKSGGSFQKALVKYANEHLEHGVFDGEDMGTLMPDYQLIDPKKPKIMWPDDSWVASVMNGVHKSPYSRIRTRRADARQADLRAKGYEKGRYKTETGKIKLLGRTTDPQTIFTKDSLNRDDIIDQTDFSLIEYNWDVMRHEMDQTIATAILIGDGRDEDDPDKIHEDKIRPIWTDKELYCIHADVDIAAAKAELQGSDTGVHFGDNYIYAEAIITASLYAREQYKGSGSLVFYCTPHILNIMMLARDLNGRRIYSSKNDLVAALNVRDIKTIEQFNGLSRKDEEGNVHKLLGLFVDLSDYQLGCVKGGQITSFQQFDIDYNKEKMLLETRLSGALVEPYSAIALEEPAA